MKRIIYIVLFSAFLIGISGLMGFIYLENSKQNLADVEVNIVRNSDIGFLSQNLILGLIEPFDSLEARQIKEINTKGIEEEVAANPHIKRVDAFINIDKQLVINVEEKTPFLRIANMKGKAFYIDETGTPFPLSDLYTPLTTIASGYIDIEMDGVTGLPRNWEESKIIAELHYLMGVISRSDFMKAQIGQIYVNSKGEFDLIPEVGEHIIQLGNLEDLENKLDNLELWYTRSFVREGDKYSFVNLRFKDQVVCTRKQQ